MKKLITSGALIAALVVPAAAAADDPSPADFKNAAKYCKAFKAASGSNNFNQMFGMKKNAYGKCVSQTAKKNAAEDQKQEQTAKKNAAQQCKAEQSDANFASTHGGKTFEQQYGTNKSGNNAFGKCVSQKAKENKQSADQQDKAEDKAKVNAAKKCKALRRDDKAEFEHQFGTKKNAFGKCVSRNANGSVDQYTQS